MKKFLSTIVLITLFLLIGKNVYGISIYSGLGDGYISYTDNTNSWATCRGNGDGDTAYPSVLSGAFGVSLQEGYGTPHKIIIRRGFFVFDLSEYAEETLESATINLWVTSKVNTDNDGTDTITIVEGTQASTSTLTTADYDALGEVDWVTPIDIELISIGEYNSFTFNSTGTTAIQNALGGWLKLASREGHDAGNIAIADGYENAVNGYFADQTGTDNDPYIELTFTAEEEEQATGTVPVLDEDETIILQFLLMAIGSGVIVGILILALNKVFKK